jgi:conjugative relaxase-like TrwC/TraI family protein
MVAATFAHDLSRNRDPFAHIHAVIANTLRPDGAWRAVHNDQLYKQQSVIAAVFNADLRSRVEELGYGIRAADAGRHGQFEIAGVSREAVLAYSTRSAEIEIALEAAGRTGTFDEREVAVFATRQRKTRGQHAMLTARNGRNVPRRSASIRTQSSKPHWPAQNGAKHCGRQLSSACARLAREAWRWWRPWACPRAMPIL